MRQRFLNSLENFSKVSGARPLDALVSLVTAEVGSGRELADRAATVLAATLLASSASSESSSASSSSELGEEAADLGGPRVTLVGGGGDC